MREMMAQFGGHAHAVAVDLFLACVRWFGLQG